jgi:hypothetical protein
MSRIKDYFAPIEEPDNMPYAPEPEPEPDQAEDQGQQVFAHMIRELTQRFRPELDFD